MSTGSSETCFVILPTSSSHLPTAPQLIPGMSLLTYTFILIVWNQETSQDSISSSPAGSRAGCPPSSRWLLYSVPEDSAAQIAYLKKRGYPISFVEMGEEADGQHMQPEDYGALYVQWARALHGVDPSLKLGGPAFQGVMEDIKAWPDARGRNFWFSRFLDYLKTHGQFADFAFMSFEHYPCDGCQTPWKNLYQEPQLLTHIMQVWRDDGLPADIPLLDTKTNAHGGEASVDICGALWLGDTFAGFLTAGGKATSTTMLCHTLRLIPHAAIVGEPITCS
jgi:hypothetical protein